MANKKSQNFSEDNISQVDQDILDHISNLEPNISFNVIVDYFSIPPGLQNHNTYFSIFHKVKHQKSTSYIYFLNNILSDIDLLITKFKDELFLAKFHSISKEEHDTWVMSNVFIKLKINQNTYDIKKYPLTKSKLLSLKNEIEKFKKNYLETKINTKINLRVNTIELIFNGIKDFFISDEHEELKEVLNGKSLNGKITFTGNQSQLAELFRRLKYNNKLDTKYSEIEGWLCSNFKYSKEGKELNPNSIKEILMAKGGRDISKTKRILTNHFPYKKPDSIKSEKDI
jgi:hypothetical protein